MIAIENNKVDEGKIILYDLQSAPNWEFSSLWR